MPSPAIAFCMTLPAEFTWRIPLLAAPFVGSFVGLVAHRLSRAEPIVFGRSACPSCQATLTARDLIPLFSWLAARGRCRHCDTSLSARYPLTELAALVIAIWAVSALSGWSILVGCLLGWALLTLALVDLREKMLPDAITLPFIAIGLAAALVLEPLVPLDHAIGAASGLTIFLAVGATFRRLRGYDGLGWLVGTGERIVVRNYKRAMCCSCHDGSRPAQPQPRGNCIRPVSLFGLLGRLVVWPADDWMTLQPR